MRNLANGYALAGRQSESIQLTEKLLSLLTVKPGKVAIDHSKA